MKIETNVNHYASIKLTERGINILIEKHRALYDGLIARNGYTSIRTVEKFTADLHKKIAENNGYYKAPLWSIMEVFGSYLCNGCEVPFDTRIILNDAKEITE